VEWGLPGVANTNPDATLSSWEFWRHSAERAIRQEVGLTDHGPTVLFVARAVTDDEPKKSKREFSFRIVPDCGAIPSIAIYLSAVLAFPALWRKKIPGIIFGLTALFGINVMRLVILAYVGAYDTTPDDRWFTFIHEYVWQSIFLLFVVVVWLVWIEWLNRGQEKAA
jgi:exosortase/archaeosortase family protein